jgi:CheY-specific phosphatase CheX
VGYLVLSCPTAVAAELARRVLGDASATLDAAMIRDCVGEIANVIAGQAKTRLYGTPHHFNLTPPTFGGEIPPSANAERWVLSFSSDVGEFAVHVRLPATEVQR